MRRKRGLSKIYKDLGMRVEFAILLALGLVAIAAAMIALLA
jgi:hypothetical protein